MTPEELVGTARDALAAAYLRTGDYEAVDALLQESVDGAHATGDRKAEAAALALQGMTLHFQAIEYPPEERAKLDHGPEHELFERALAIRREVGDAEGTAESLWQVGLFLQVLRGDSEQAAPLFAEALALLDEHPDADVWLRSEVHRHVGFDHLVRHEDYDAALAELRTSLELRETLAERGWVASALTALSTASRRGGRRDEAIGYARRAVKTAREEGLRERHVTAAEDALRAAEEDLGEDPRPRSG